MHLNSENDRNPSTIGIRTQWCLSPLTARGNSPESVITSNARLARIFQANLHSACVPASLIDLLKNMVKKPAGFILIYVIGILIFLGTVGLGVAYTLRINAQLVLNEKEIMQNDRLLESAVQYALAQLIKARLAEPVLKAMDKSAIAKLEIWKKDDGPYQVQIQGNDIGVQIEDAGDMPDINVLTKEEIQRIFESFGALAAEAVKLAEILINARDKAGKERGGNGFSSIQQLLALEEIPARYRFGVKPEEEAAEKGLSGALAQSKLDAGKASASAQPGLDKPGLDKLVVVGTGIKNVNLNRAPLPVIFALIKTDAAALARFDTARKAHALTLSEAAQILGEPARQALSEGASAIYRIRVNMEKIGRTYSAVAIAKEDGGNFKILSYRISQPGSE